MDVKCEGKGEDDPSFGLSSCREESCAGRSLSARAQQAPEPVQERGPLSPSSQTSHEESQVSWLPRSSSLREILPEGLSRGRGGRPVHGVCVCRPEFAPT